MLKWIEIHREALISNLLSLRGLLSPSTRLLLVVKANAYGHGWRQVSAICEEKNLVDWYGVHSVEEGLALRAAGIKRPVLVLGYVESSMWNEALKADLRLTVFDQASLRGIDRTAKKLGLQASVHLKVETGTGRQGILEEQWPAMAETFKTLGNVILEGLSTHYANIEDTTDHQYAQEQKKRFELFRERIRRDGFNPQIGHTACSAAILLFPWTHDQMVRLGISAYGYWPSKETYLSFLQSGKSPLSLQRVLSFKGRLGQIKDLPAKSYIGYGLSYKTTQPTRVALLPMGYSDGLDRGLSNLGYFLVKGERAPIRGRVCMNLTILDITGISGVELEEPVTLIGRDGEEEINADTWGEWTGTISYEVLARLPSDLPRIVV